MPVCETLFSGQITAKTSQNLYPNATWFQAQIFSAHCNHAQLCMAMHRLDIYVQSVYQYQ